MHAKITKRWKAVPTGLVYPRTYAVGDVVDGELAERALAGGVAEEHTPDDDTASSAAPAEGAETTEATQTDQPARVAKVLRQGEFDGERYPKGVRIEDAALATRMVDAGFAQWLDDKPGPEANKSAGAAPSVKS